MALANRLPTESRPWVEDWTIEAPDANPSSTSTIARLAKECTAVSRRVLQRIKAHPDISQATYHALEKSHSSLALWEAGYGVGEGKLDELLAKSQTLSKSMLGPLVNISAILTRKLIPLAHSESKPPISHQGLDDVTTEAKTSLHVDFDGSSDSEDSGSESSSSSDRANDWDEIQEDLATEVECLLVLDPIIRCPAPDIRKRRGNHGKEKIAIDWQPHQSYSDKITNRFPDAAAELVDRLARANWERFLKTKTAREENIAAAEEDAKAAEVAVAVVGAEVGVQLEHALTDPVSSKFNDSGVGSSIRTDTSYAETIMSYQAQGRESVRVPPLPEGARQGKPFDCVACGRQLRIKNNSAWKRHLYLDLCPWICHDVTCKFGNQLFASRQNWIEHLSLGHDFAPDWASFECPFCLRETGQGKITISAHLSSHMEEISLAALPVGADDDHTDDSDAEGAATPESQAEAEDSELFAVENTGQELPFLTMVHQRDTTTTRGINDWTVDIGNLSGHHLITDQLALALGYQVEDFTQTNAKSISITGGAVQPIGSIFVSWAIWSSRLNDVKNDLVGSIFEVISNDSLPASLRKFSVLFSALASSNDKADDSTAYVRQVSQTDRIEALYSMATAVLPGDRPDSWSTPWIKSSHHGRAVPGIADNGGLEMEQQARAPASGRRPFSSESRDGYASDMASDGSDSTEVPAKIGIEDIRNRHTTWGQFTCPYPDCHRHLRGLTRKDDLYRHLQQMHGPEPYPCPHTDCERHKNGLPSPITFCRHIDDVHELKPKGRPDFTCPYTDCEYYKAGNGFRLLNELVRHKRDAHGELSIGKNYICRRGSCAEKPRLWGRSDNFRLHLERIHKLNIGPEDDLAEYLFNQDTDQVGDGIALYACHHMPCTNTELRLHSDAHGFRAHLARVHKIVIRHNSDLSQYIYHQNAPLLRNHHEYPAVASGLMCPYEDCEDRDLVFADLRHLNNHLDLHDSPPVGETTSEADSPNPEVHNGESIWASGNGEGNPATRKQTTQKSSHHEYARSKTMDPMYSHPKVLRAPSPIVHQGSSDEPPRMQVPPTLTDETSVPESRFRANDPNMALAEERRLDMEHQMAVDESRRLETEHHAAVMAILQQSEANAATEASRRQGLPSGMQAPPAPQGPRGSTGNPFTAIASKGWINPSFAPGPLDRPFKCNKCTQSFSRHHDLKRHKRIHMDSSPFTCDGCQKGFSRKDALRRHKQVKACGKQGNGEDAKAQDVQVTPAAEKKDNSSFEAIKNSVMHQLALGPRTQESVLEKLGCEDDEDFKKGFNAAAALETPGSSIWTIKRTLWTQLDVWAYKGYTSEERDQAIHNARIQYNLMRLSLADPVWDRLLPEDERNGGEKPGEPSQSGPEPQVQSSPEGSRKSLPEEAASKPGRKPRVREYRQSTNVRIAPKIARRDSSSDEDRAGPAGHGEQEEDVELQDFNSVFQSLTPEFRARLIRNCNSKDIELRSPQGENEAKLCLLEQISQERLARARLEQRGAVHRRDDASQDLNIYLSRLSSISDPEVKRRMTDAGKLLAENGVNPSSLSTKQILNIANQSRKLHNSSLAVFAQHMAKQVQATYQSNNEDEPDAASASTAESQSAQQQYEGIGNTAVADDNMQLMLSEERRKRDEMHDKMAREAAALAWLPGNVRPLPPPRPSVPARLPSPWHECPFCDQLFSRYTELREHASTAHDASDLFPCAMCFSYFQTYDGLARHLSSRHPSIVYDDASSSEGYSYAAASEKPSRTQGPLPDFPPPLPPPRFLHQCPICKGLYTNHAALNEHAWTTHGLDKVFPCGWCLSCFQTSEELSSHVSNNHPGIETLPSSSEGYRDAGALGRPPPLPAMRVPPHPPDEASDGDTSMKSLSPPPRRKGVVLPPPSPSASHQSFTGPEPPNPFARFPPINEALPSVLPPAPPMESRPPMVGMSFAPEGPSNPFARPPPRVSVHDEPDSSRLNNAPAAEKLALDALSALKRSPSSPSNPYIVDAKPRHGSTSSYGSSSRRSHDDERSHPQTHPFVQVTSSQPQNSSSPRSDKAEEV